MLDREGRVAALISGELPSLTTLVDAGRGRRGAERWVTGSRARPASGSLLLAIPVALVAGLVSFFSPCVIPLLPGYLSYATGLSGADLATGEAGDHRGRMLLGSVLFVLGFTVVFVILGAAVRRRSAAWLRRRGRTRSPSCWASLLDPARAGLRRRWCRCSSATWRVHTVPAVGLAAAPLLGFLFGSAGPPASARRSA